MIENQDLTLVLIVEDSLTQAEELRYILENNAFEVLHAINAEKGLALLKTYTPQLIISDIVMPGMDGFEFCAQVKSTFQHIPLILLTSLTDPIEILKGLACGSDSFITKPYKEEFLLNKIHYLLSNFKIRKEAVEETNHEILYKGEKYTINSSRLQVLDLLFSTYENAVAQNQELKNVNRELNRTQLDLKSINQHLEELVSERTQELLLNQQLLVTLTSEAPIILFSINKDGIFTKSEGKGLTKLGLIPGEIVGVSAFDFYRNYPVVIEQLNQALNGKEVRSILNINEIFFDILYQPVFNAAGVVESVVGVAVDVTEQRLAVAQLSESETKFRNVFENSMLGKSITAMDGTLSVNKSFCDILGYTEQEMTTINWKEVTHPDDVGLSNYQIEKILQQEISHASFQKRYIHKDGHIVYADVLTSLYRNERKEPQYFITSIKDISDRIEAENKLAMKSQQLEESNREKEEIIATKDKLFSIIAHDLKGNFSPLLGFAELLIEKMDQLSKEDIQSTAKVLHESLEKQHQLLNNLLEWGHVQRGSLQFNPEIQNLRDVLLEQYQLLNQNLHDKKISIVSDVDHDIALWADKHMLDTILRNLLSNAVKFSNIGGQVHVTTQQKDTFHQINISDFGIGVKPENLGKLLNKNEFLSTKGTKNEKGSGLGLILCREFVETHGGRIWVESQVGKGTTFSFTIPQK